MPCLYCGAPQVDPQSGPSAWAVGVRVGRQVLVCAACQRVHDLDADLDHCPSCGSVKLRRQLDVTVCRACGWQPTAEEWTP